MFSRIKIFFKRKKLQKWGHVDTRYQHKDYFFMLSECITDILRNNNPGSSIDAYIDLSMHYENLYSWFNATRRLRSALHYGELKQQPSLGVKKVTLNKFLVSDDNRNIEYRSAVIAVINTLTEIYTKIEEKYRNENEFIFRQYKEVFIDGIVLLETIL